MTPPDSPAPGTPDPVDIHHLTERADAALQVLATYRSADAPTHGGRVLSYVYDSGLAVLDEVAASAARMVQSVNGLDPTVFGSVAAMERDLIEFGRSVFHAPDAVGSVTSGGTESCLLAVKTARDHAGAAPGQASMVLPTTAHAAFLKAAELFGVEAIRVPVPTPSTAVRADDIAGAIHDDTILVVASAPNYPTGVLDPITEIAERAGVLNLGGSGVMIADGVEYPLARVEAAYVGRGTREVSFRSDDASDPAAFYVFTAAAHVAHPTVRIPQDAMRHIDIGVAERASFRSSASLSKANMVTPCACAAAIELAVLGYVHVPLAANVVIVLAANAAAGVDLLRHQVSAMVPPGTTPNLGVFDRTVAAQMRAAIPDCAVLSMADATAVVIASIAGQPE